MTYGTLVREGPDYWRHKRLRTYMPVTDLDNAFYWKTQDGKKLLPSEMQIYAIRMIYNHTAPGSLQILGCRHYYGPDRWPASRRKRSVAALISELRKRDVPEWMRAQLNFMRQACGQVNNENQIR